MPSHMPLRVAFDANAFIGAVSPDEVSHTALRKVVDAWSRGGVAVYVSVHTLHELEKDPKALALAKRATVLPHFMIGTGNDQVGTWSQVSGTWADQGAANEKYQDLQTLAKAAADIRDLGACVDALYGGVEVFVTSDRDVVGSSPASRIVEKYALRIVEPEVLVGEIDP